MSDLLFNRRVRSRCRKAELQLYLRLVDVSTVPRLLLVVMISMRNDVGGREALEN
jgi:hypothetical protein